MPVHRGLSASSRAGGVTVERVDLSDRVGRLRFVLAGQQLEGSAPEGPGPSLLAETYRLDPHNSPALVCAEAVGLVARMHGRVVGRMVALRPTNGGEVGWFTRLDVHGRSSVLAALVAEGARWVARGGGRRWLGPVGLMPGDVCGVQVDGFVGRRASELPRWAPGTADALRANGFSVARETGFWTLPVPPAVSDRVSVNPVATQSVDLAQPHARCSVTWDTLLDGLRSSTDPVSRLSCDPDRLRHELLRTAIAGGVTFATREPEGVALGIMRPACSSVPGLRLPAVLTRLRQWKRRSRAGEGHVRLWATAATEQDAMVAGAILDRLVSRARSLGYRRLLVGPVATDANGATTALRDRGARIDCRFHVFAREIDRV